MIAIEPMTEDDIGAALAIDVHAFSGDATARETQLREELVRTWARIRVARSTTTNAVEGYVLFWHVTDEIHLLNVAVAAASRRKGIGRRLVEEVIAYARANSAAKIFLEVRASNVAARTLYRSLGFEEINVRAKYYPDGEDGVEMMLATG